MARTCGMRQSVLAFCVDRMRSTNEVKPSDIYGQKNSFGGRPHPHPRMAQRPIKPRCHTDPSIEALSR